MAATGEPVPVTPIPPPPTLVAQPSFAPLDHDLGPGNIGDSVIALQDRLRALAFDPGPSDGVFGPATERSVWAFEKFILDHSPAGATGVVTADVWRRMNDAIEVRPRRAGGGAHLEVLLPQQVAVLYVDDAPQLITHISSGSGEQWCDVVTVDNDDGTQSETGVCGSAVTPGGVFHFERRYDGWRNAKLGRLYNPVYFNYGLAVHGSSNVPKFPASHGCVRIPMHIAEYFPSLVANGDAVYVFDGVKEPEVYGSQVPIFDWPDPSDTTTTTTSSTTTTVPATTSTSPAATLPPTPHPHPATTTTSALTSSTTAAPAGG